MPIRLKELREKKGLNMREAAKQLGLAPSTYHNYETGAREPNSEMLIKLANFYGCSIDYLIGNEIRYKSEVDELTDQIRHKPELRRVVRLLSGASIHAPFLPTYFCHSDEGSTRRGQRQAGADRA